MAEYVQASPETDKIEALREYLTSKAKVHLEDGGKDGIIRREWNRLNRKFLMKEFEEGRRDFWGVIIDDTGYPLEDKDAPEYLLKWKIVMVYSTKQLLEVKHKDKNDADYEKAQEWIKDLDKQHKELLKELHKTDEV